MNKFAIVADSTGDVNPHYAKKLDIDVMCAHVIQPDKSEMPNFLNWSDEQFVSFYKELGKNPDGFSTAPPNIDEFAVEFERLIEGGFKEILFITISGALSGTYNFACLAREQVLKSHPDAKIVCIDSRRFSVGYGTMVIKAAELRAEGKSFDEVCKFVEENNNRIHQCGWLDDLSFVARKGRLTHSKAFFGKLAGIKPIGEFDYNGLTTVIGKVKGAKKAYPILLDYLEATAEDMKNQTIFIAQTNRLAAAEEYKKLIEERFSPKEVVIVNVYPSCGVNVGPGLMAAYYFGKPISEGLEEEKALLETLMAKK